MNDNGPSTKNVAPPPSAPRAMASGAPSGASPRHSRADLGPNRDRDWKGQRDNPPHPTLNGSGPSSQAPIASLRSRIGEPFPSSPTTSQRPGNTHGFERRNESSHQNDDLSGDNKKRTLSGEHFRGMLIHVSLTMILIHLDREKEKDSNMNLAESAVQPPKRPRILRNRYTENSAGFARRVLPIDPQAGDKGDRPGGKD